MRKAILRLPTALLEWLRSQGWGWRLRCKQDLLVFDKDGGETKLADCFARGEHMLTDVELTEKRARTNIAMLHEQGHAEPWIIAPSDPPTLWRAQDYGLRWGIEAMFSDYKTRGFNLEDSQIERTDRLDRLVLVFKILALDGRFPPECGTRCKTRRLPKKRHGSAT